MLAWHTQRWRRGALPNTAKNKHFSSLQKCITIIRPSAVMGAHQPGLIESTRSAWHTPQLTSCLIQELQCTIHTTTWGYEQRLSSPDFLHIFLFPQRPRHLKVANTNVPKVTSSFCSADYKCKHLKFKITIQYSNKLWTPHLIQSTKATTYNIYNILYIIHSIIIIASIYTEKPGKTSMKFKQPPVNLRPVTFRNKLKAPVLFIGHGCRPMKLKL